MRSLLASVQGLLVSVLFWTAYALFTFVFSPGSLAFWHGYLVYWAVILGGFGLEMMTRKSNRLIAPIYDSSLVRQLPIAFRQMVFTLGSLLVFLALAKDHTISRVFLASFAVALYPLLVWSNATLPVRLSRAMFRSTRENGTLLVGPVRRVAGLQTWLARKERLGVKIVGLIPTDPPSAPIMDCPVPLVGNIGRLEEILADAAISQVIFLELGQPEFTRWLLSRCEQHGVRLLIINDLAEQIHHPIVCGVDEGVNLITLHEEPLENPFNRVIKRATDVTLSLAVVVLVLPWLSVLVWILQRLQSPGPLLHLQQRAGLQNHAFEIMKFRTMHPHTAELSQQATGDDARIYPAGRWLRRFSLDEIPQFLNVLSGEMSVVGPRPHLIEHNRQFADVMINYHVRTFIKPGITGLAQVRGFRGEAKTQEDIAARLESDLVYLENWSLSLELGIILRTAWQMVRPPKTAV